MCAVRRAGTVVGVAVGLVLSTFVPAGAEPEVPALGHAERVAGLGSPFDHGTGYSGDGFAATKARLGREVRIAVAGDGDVLVADRDNRRLRRIDGDGVIDTVPAPAAVRDGGPWFAPGFTPRVVDSGPDGSVYLSDRQQVGRFGQDGSWAVVGGGGEADFRDGGTGGDGGPATGAFLDDVENLDVDAAGAVYLTDGHSGRVRRIDAGGTITTVAGGGTTAPSTTPVPATSARFTPYDVAVDPDGGFWVVDHQRLSEAETRLLHVDPEGMLISVPLDERFSRPFPFPIAVGQDGTVYLAARSILYELAEDGTTTMLGGPFGGDITDIAVARDGTVYAATPGAVERLVVPDGREGRKLPAARAAADRWAGDEPGTVHRVAGDGRYRESGHRPSTEPGLRPTRPRDVAAAPEGGAYVLDPGNGRVLLVSQDGEVEEFATLPPGQGHNLVGLARGGDGALHTLDAKGGVVFRIGTDGAVTSPRTVPVAENHYPAALVVDKTGNVYLPSRDGEVLLRIAPDGGTVPVTGGGDLDGGAADGRPATRAAIYLPQAAAVGQDGSVAVLEDYVNAVRVVRPDGTLTTIAGDADTSDRRSGFGGDGGPATAALLNVPRAVAFAPDGTVYIADTFNNRVRRIDRNGVITTVAGTGERDETGDGGPATRAALVEPDHLAVADDGALWVTSAASTRVRRIDRNGTITTPADFAGTDADPSAIPAGELAVRGYALAVDRKGTVYVDGADQSIHAVSSGKSRPAFGTTGGGGLPVVATAADGSLYHGGKALWHRFPDGAEVPVLGAAPAEAKPSDGADAQTVGILPTDIAVHPDGTLFVATMDAVYALAGGRLDQRWHVGDRRREDDNRVTGIATGPDGTLYVALDGHEVVAVDDGKARRFAGVGDDTVVDDDIGDGGTATDAVLRSPSDVAVTGDGSVFVSTLDGIRRIDPDGDIDTVLVGHTIREGPTTTYAPPTSLAVDAHDNLYFTEPSLNQVRVVVRPAAMPDQSGTSSWWWWLGGGAVALAAAAFLVWRRRTRSAADGGAGQDAPVPDGSGAPAPGDADE